MDDEDFDSLIDGFKPQFGNQTHVAIADAMEQIIDLRRRISNADKAQRDANKAREELGRLKENVIWLLKQA